MTTTYLQSALQAGQAAKDLIQENLNTDLVITNKTSPRDIVTQIDIASEKLIRGILSKNHPEHSILGEEGGQTGASEFCWVLDPIDGTSNFARGVPHFCVSIALEKAGKGQVGVIVNPSLNDIYSAELRQGAFKNSGAKNAASENSKRIHVSHCKTLTEAYVTMSFSSHDLNVCKPIWDTLLDKSQVLRRLGATALELAYVAEGRTDAFLGLGQSPWDTAAGTLLVKEAGGFVTLFDGGKGCLACSSQELMDELLELMGMRKGK